MNRGCASASSLLMLMLEHFVSFTDLLWSLSSADPGAKRGQLALVE
jgi:hypothetical protein